VNLIKYIGLVALRVYLHRWKFYKKTFNTAKPNSVFKNTFNMPGGSYKLYLGTQDPTDPVETIIAIK